MKLSFRPQSRHQLIVWLAALILLLTAVLLFLELAEDVWLNEGFAWDATLMLGIHSLSQPWLDKFFWLVALSRVYLGAHHPSDVLASLAIGTIWLVIVWFVYTGHHNNYATNIQQT